MARYKGLLLDLDNTLYPFSPCHEAGLNAVFQKLNTIGMAMTFGDFKRDFEKAKNLVKEKTTGQAASHNRVLYFQYYLELKKSWSSDLVLDLYERYWEAYLQQLKLSEDAVEFLDNSSIPIVIVTDLTAHIQHRKLSRLGISSRIKALVTSEEAGIEKPHRRIFELGLKKLGVSASDALYIGDDYTKDVEGPKNAGIDALWRTNYVHPEKIEEFSNVVSQLTDFKDLYEIIG